MQFLEVTIVEANLKATEQSLNFTPRASLLGHAKPRLVRYHAHPLPMNRWSPTAHGIRDLYIRVDDIALDAKWIKSQGLAHKPQSVTHGAYSSMWPQLMHL